MPLLLAGAALLALAGAGLFWLAARQNPIATESGITVTVDGASCQPMQLEVPAGRASFRILNRSDRPLEWEILDGVMVVAERENIAPGFSAVLTERLKPGVYEITCGLLSNPRGRLTVRATAESVAARAVPPLRDFLGPLSEQRVQTMRAAGRFVGAVESLQAALAAGDRAAARKAWAGAAADWAALGPVALRASDLRNRIAPRADGLAAGESDASFTGLSRIEYGLFAQDSAAGLLPVAQALLADAQELQTRAGSMQATPDILAGDAARYARTLADGAVVAGLAPYAGDDRAILAAALDCIRRSHALVAGLVSAADPGLAARIGQALAAADAALNTEPLDRPAVAKAFGDLAEALGSVNAGLGLEG